MSVTLTQVLAERNRVRLFGHKVSDFALRGDLGLGGLDPEGPIVFASIDAYALGSGPVQALSAPLLLSVHGEGEPADAAERPWSARRCWVMDRDESTWLATLQRTALATLLEPAADSSRADG